MVEGEEAPIGCHAGLSRAIFSQKSLGGLQIKTGKKFY